MTLANTEYTSAGLNPMLRGLVPGLGYSMLRQSGTQLGGLSAHLEALSPAIRLCMASWPQARPEPGHGGCVA